LTNPITFNLVDKQTPVQGQKLLSTWIINSVKMEKKTLGHISINICSDEYLIKMNRTTLSHNYYTDIITFDFCEGSHISGDIYISRDRVKENAQTHAVTLKKEMSRVIIHGILHLCGYRDKSEADIRLMRDKENYYLSLQH